MIPWVSGRMTYNFSSEIAIPVGFTNSLLQIYSSSYRFCQKLQNRDHLLPAIKSIRVNKMKYFSECSGDIHGELYYWISNEINRRQFYLQLKSIFWAYHVNKKAFFSSNTCQFISGAVCDRITPCSIRRIRSFSFQTVKYWLPPILPHLITKTNL